MGNTVTPSSPDLLMTYGVGQLSGLFSNVYVNGVLNGFPANDSLSYTGGSLEIVSGVVSGGGTWTGLGGTTSWATSGNWSSTAVPSSGTVVFPELGATAPIAVSLDGPQSAGALVFSATEGYASAWQQQRHADLGHAGQRLDHGVSRHALHFGPVVLAGSLTVSESGSSLLTLAGNLTGGTVQSLTLAGDGSGTLVLSGTNTYGGGTYLEAGMLVVNTAGSIPAGTSLTVGAGGTFIFDPTDTGSPLSGGAVSAGVTAVPESGTLALLAAGLIAAGVTCLRRKLS